MIKLKHTENDFTYIQHQNSTINHNPKILILDPIVKSARSLKSQLLSKLPSAEVDICTNILYGVKKSQNNKYDLTVFDMDFSGINGIEFINLLKEYDPLLRIIAVTNNYSLENIFGIMREGVEYHLQKPFNKSRFLAMVKTALNTVVYRQHVLEVA